MIDISDALAGESIPAARCKFGKLLDAVPTDQAAELVKRLEGDAWTDKHLAALISGTAFGHVGKTVLSEHRRRECSCDFTETDAA